MDNLILTSPAHYVCPGVLVKRKVNLWSSLSSGSVLISCYQAIRNEHPANPRTASPDAIRARKPLTMDGHCIGYPYPAWQPNWLLAARAAPPLIRGFRTGGHASGQRKCVDRREAHSVLTAFNKSPRRSAGFKASNPWGAGTLFSLASKVSGGRLQPGISQNSRGQALMEGVHTVLSMVFLYAVSHRPEPRSRSRLS